METNPLTILCGDALEQLRTLSDESVHCCVTSPPYWGLRDYGDNGQLGLEKTPEEYVAKMVAVFREVRRVLRKDGTLWLNLGDSYNQNNRWGGQEKCNEKQMSNAGTRDFMKPVSVNAEFNSKMRGNSQITSSAEVLGSARIAKAKELVGIPWLVAFALSADGWWLRSDIIWAKPNPMPESVTDRPTKAHEYLFLLTKSANYFYDAEAIKEKSEWFERDRRSANGRTPHKSGKSLMPESQYAIEGVAYSSDGSRNKRSVWTVATAPYPEAHFATYPPDLIKPCILAGTSAKGCCAKCGSPWERVLEDTGQKYCSPDAYGRPREYQCEGQQQEKGGGKGSQGFFTNVTKTIGWQPTCRCDSGVEPCVCLDPFAGSGTTGAVALELGRKAILIELNPKYVELIKTRCNVTMGLALA